ncbi:MAG: UDP-3-O-acyl-N-acetylglucosamine deacetylase, partial [Pseudomonadota bacterium]
YDVTVSFDDAAIGEQRLILSNPADYRSMISGARTFCYLKDVEAMRAKGLALGGSFENAVVVDDGTILNKEGLRADNEFVAHKTLDLIGDLYLLGAPLAAKITAYKPGHEINTQFAQAVIPRGAARWVRAEMHREAARVLA